MLDVIAILCLAGAIAILAILCVIDMRVRLLPNEFVATFAALGVVFHLATLFRLLPPSQALIGAIAGFGILYLIRMAANAYYKQDSLGLGDVKLLGAAGLWLGPEGVLFAVTAGSFAGLIHGIVYAGWLSWKHKTPYTLHRLKIPAGPGFAVGIISVGAYMYCDYVRGVFQ